MTRHQPPSGRPAPAIRVSALNPEGRGQNFRRAAEALALGSPNGLPTGLLALAIASRPELAALSEASGATAADAAEALLEKAALFDALEPLPKAELDRRRAALTIEEKRRALERAAASAAADRRRAVKHIQEKRTGGSAREAAAARLLAGPAGRLPFDARHHGSAVPRETAWKLGLVCWRRTLTHARSAQLSEAFLRLADETASSSRAARIDSLLKAAGWAWAHRRPLVLIPAATSLTMKLVCDAWLADRLAAAVICGQPYAANPFERLGIPCLFDPAGAAAALLGLTHLPAVVEPRLGGFAVYAAGGPPSLEAFAPGRRERPESIAPWVRTLALIGLLAKHDDAGLASLAERGRRLPAAKRFGWYSAFQALADFPVNESREGLAAPQREFLTAVNVSVRRQFERVRAALAREANAAEADLIASRRRRRAAERAAAEAEDAAAGELADHPPADPAEGAAP